MMSPIPPNEVAVLPGLETLESADLESSNEPPAKKLKLAKSWSE